MAIVNPNMVNALTGRTIDAAPNVGGAIGQGLQNADRIQQIQLAREKMMARRQAEQRAQDFQRILAQANTPEERMNALMAIDPKTAIDYQNSNLAVEKFGAEQEGMEGRNAFFQTLSPEEQAFARAFPEDFARQYAKNAFVPEGGEAAEYGLNPVYIENPDGTTSIVQLSKSGSVLQPDLPDGARVLPGMQFLDVGTGYVPASRRTGRPEGGFIDKDIEGEEAAKGRGRTQAERESDKPKVVQSFRDLNRQWDIVLEDIDKALEDTDFWTSGWVGRLTDAVPGTPAYNLARTLDTIKANIGFDKLQSMRDNSPTGGALGQVSEFENRLLQAVQGSLEQGQSAEQLRDNLERIRLNLQGLRSDRMRAFEDTYGEPIAPYVGGLEPSKVPMVGGVQQAPGTGDAGNRPEYRGLSPEERRELEELRGRQQ